LTPLGLVVPKKKAWGRRILDECSPARFTESALMEAKVEEALIAEAVVEMTF
jgi:hypothetical protein